MHTKKYFCESLYNICKELRDQLEIELSIAKRDRKSALAKEGHAVIVLANKLLSLYEENEEQNESA